MADKNIRNQILAISTEEDVFKPYRVVESDVQYVPYRRGNIIFTTDVGNIYLDTTSTKEGRVLCSNRVLKNDFPGLSITTEDIASWNAKPSANVKYNIATRTKPGLVAESDDVSVHDTTGAMTVNHATNADNATSATTAGTATSATTAAGIKDAGDGRTLTVNYSAKESDPLYLASWTGSGVLGTSTPTQIKSKLNLSKTDVGLGNVNNTADADKTVKNAGYATNAGKVNNLTIETAVPKNAKFTDTTYGVAGTSLGLVKEGGDIDIDASGNMTVKGKVGQAVSGGGEIFNYYDDPLKNIASGAYSHAEGTRTTASETSSHAEGSSTTASGTSSHAEGSSTTASGRFCHVEGWYSEAGGEQCAHAEGDHTKASGEASHAEGYYTEASGETSHAEGHRTAASGKASHAEGYYTKALGAYSHVEGFSNKPDNSGADGMGRRKYLHIAGNGREHNGAIYSSNAYTLDWEGNGWYQKSIAIAGTDMDASDAKLDSNSLTLKSTTSSKKIGLSATADEAVITGATNLKVDGKNVIKEGDSRLADARTPKTHTHTKSQITDFAHRHNVSDIDGNWPSSRLTGEIPSSLLPSYVDDVIEVKNYASLPGTGETGKIYITQDTNKTYRWSGSAYVVISETLALGTTSSTAFRGDYGNTAYQHVSDKENPHEVTAAQVGLGNVDNTADSTKSVKYAATAGSAPASDVSAWAKKSTKPSYNLGEISDTSAYVKVSPSEKTTWNNKVSNFTASASVSNTTGTPNIKITKGGTTTEPTYAFAFSGIKGEKGETGPQGPTGSAGSNGTNGKDGLTTKVTVNGNTYTHSNGTITLPNYPTTLPASDVKGWAKADSKPTYSASEVGAAASDVVLIQSTEPTSSTCKIWIQI